MVAIAKIKHTAKESGVRPSFAVVFHESCSDNHIVCATRHYVNNNNTLSIGRVISAGLISKSFAELNIGHSTTPFECIPESVLYDSAETLVWYKQRFVGDMWFRVGKKPERLVVEWPALLFIANKTNPSLKIFALGSNKRPVGSTKLYHAPLMNLNAQGGLCQGTAALPSQIQIATIAQCEATLFDSQFTHVNHDHTLRSETDNASHFAYWKSKAKRKSSLPQRVRASELAPTNRRLQEIVRGKR